ncbi:DUF1523 family protein [Rhodobacterales bacterium HKCCE3408]|nr:DUF1523 family protein [Rhodobacterales bacterium HKCCE3408]
MRWPRIIFLTLILLIVGGFLNYTLPDRQVVRIVDTETRRVDFSNFNRMFYGAGDSGGPTRTDSREIWFIQSIDANGRTRVFRNEDTGLFGWPPYLKTRSQDLQTEAADLASTEANPRWVVVTHYGWRSNWLSVYPNAVAIREVDSPDVSLFPWLNIIILGVIALILFALWRLWERFEARVIDPVVDGIAVRWAKMRDWFAGRS